MTNDTPSPETHVDPVNPGDPYLRMVMFFDQDNTAGSFLSDDGEGGFVGAVSRMAREIDRLRASLPEPKNHVKPTQGLRKKRSRRNSGVSRDTTAANKGGG